MVLLTPWQGFNQNGLPPGEVQGQTSRRKDGQCMQLVNAVGQCSAATKVGLLFSNQLAGAVSTRRGVA